MQILFLSIYESGTLLNMRQYLLSKTNTSFDYMVCGLLIQKDKKLTKEIYFVDTNGVRKAKDLSLAFSLPLVGRILFQFISQVYAFVLLLWITRKKRYDICIGETPTLALFSWIYRKIGKSNMSIFHVSDIYGHVGGRFTAPFFTFLQRLLRRIAYKNDLIGYHHDRLREWDKAHGFSVQKYFVTSTSFDPEEVDYYIKKDRIPFQICYIGRLDKHSGLDVVIQSLVTVRKHIPKIFLKVVGGYQKSDIAFYRDIAEREHVSDCVEFLGYVASYEEMKNIIAHCNLGMAIYSTDVTSSVLYTFSGKIFDYLRTGTPIVTTRGSSVLSEILEKYEAGVFVTYDTKDVARVIISVLQSDGRVQDLQEGIKRFVYDFRHEKVQSEIYQKIISFYNHFCDSAVFQPMTSTQYK